MPGNTEQAMTNPKISGVAFFDVDDTILKGSSGIMLAKYMFLTRGEGASPSYIFDMARAIIDVKTGAVDYDNLVEKGLSQFRGRTLAEVEQIAQGCFDRYMRRSVYRLAYREIRNHQAEGRHAVLLTASFKTLIDPLAEFLGVDHSITLKPIYENGVLTGHAEKPFCYHGGKLILAKEYAQEYGVSLDDCYFYSDSSSDLPLMEKVGHPRPTCPDPTLKRLAILKNWRMHFFHSVLPPDFVPEHWR